MRRNRRLVGRDGPPDPKQQLEQLREDLRGDSSEFPITDLRPVLIPSAILAPGTWVGPYHYFSGLPISLTWAYLRPNQTMMYLSDRAVASLEKRRVDCRT